MNILALLQEADLFRYSDRWETDERPVIQVNGREGMVGRENKGAAAWYPYCVHFGLTEMGFKVPRRWASTFTATGQDSTYMQSFSTDAGMRKITIEPTRECGWCYDDFNAEPVESLIEDLFEIKERYEIDEATDLGQKIMSFISGTYKTNDTGYYDFVTTLDKWEKRTPGVKSAIVASVKSLIDQNYLGVGTAADIPNGDWEVWFEGPYEAVSLISDEDDE